MTRKTAFPRNRICNALDQYSLRGHSQELEKSIVDKVYVLKPLALKGQSTAIFARPNVGKTVITVAQLIEAIVSGRIDPDRTYYFNVDDTGIDIFISKGTGVDPDLLAMCQRYATPGQI